MDDRDQDQGQECPGLAQFEEVVERLCAAATSPSQARQYRMVLGELTRAMDAGYLPVSGCVSLSELLAEHVVTAYLTVARERRLTTRLDVHSTPAADNTERVRHRVLMRVAALAGVPLRLPEGPAVVLRETLTDEMRESLWRYAVAEADVMRPGTGGWRAALRAAAAVGVVLSTGARSGELADQVVTDVSADLREVAIVRFPQHGQRSAGTREVFELDARVRPVMRRYLDQREQLVGGLQGAPPEALWVVVRGGGTPTHGMPALPGTPVSAVQLRLVYSRLVRRLNAQRTEAGLELLPRRMEQLRRSVAPEPLRCGNSARARDRSDPGDTAEDPAATAA
ncbi:hypothetical protein [Streptomyces sp. CAI-85]|uniref:hypothetical protein n=1 Tax=Streptomyces sp. CAI-85 TaxID=1472662 RepID=UPI001587013D|nr:hypothetical protein [Streptomyces sp. CAI-85]NUV64316.1 hypothetical protein [Streptomyces sp. CAI-85]